MANSTSYGDIVLADIPFVIDVATWREKDIIDFAPRATTPGGSTVFSDLGLFQPQNQTSWQHGMGFHWYSDAEGFMYTTGNIDTRHEGLTMLYTSPTIDYSVTYGVGVTTKHINGFITFAGSVYIYGDFGLYKRTGVATWTSVYNTAGVHMAINGGSYLFFCPDGARIKKMTSAGTVTDAGLDANSIDYKWIIVHNGYAYAGIDGTNRVHFDSNEDLSQLEGTTSDPEAIYVGLGSVATVGAIVYAGQLYVARWDGLWLLGEDRIARRVIDHSHETSSANFRSMAVVNGYLIYAMRDKVLQWNGARVQDITPPKVTDSYPYVTYGTFKAFLGVDNSLYCLASTNEATTSYALLCFDGVAWHKLHDIGTAAGYSMTAMSFDWLNNYIWFGWSTNTTTNGSVYGYYIPVQGNSSFPYANFPTSGTHSMVTSRYDMGFRRIQKSMMSLLFESANCTTTRYIIVYYQLDGSGTWVEWGRIKTNGVTELTMPGGLRTKEFYYLNLRFDFVTADAAQTPIMEGYTIRFIMRPNVLWGYSFYVIAGTGKISGRVDGEKTSGQIRDDLMAIRDSKAPVTLVDPTGVSHMGYITSVQGQASQRTPGEDEEPDDMEMKYIVNFAAVS